MNKVVIVDKQDKPIGFKDYSEITYKDINRVAALWLTDEKTGDVLLTQRKWTKHNDPGKWMAAASGTIEEGEDYDKNIVHEIEEEIGLKNLTLTKGPKLFTDDGRHCYFVQWFVSTTNKDEVEIRIQEEEVEAYAWIPKDEFLRDLRANPDRYVPSFKRDLDSLGVN